MVICLERGADSHMAQLMPLPLTVSCFSEIQIGFTFLVPAHPGSPGQRAVKRVCVCVEMAGRVEAVIPAALVQLWQPVLYLVNNLHLTARLLDSLAAQLSESGDWKDCLTAGWIECIIAATTAGMML